MPSVGGLEDVPKLGLLGEIYPLIDRKGNSPELYSSLTPGESAFGSQMLWVILHNLYTNLLFTNSYILAVNFLGV